MKLCRFVLLDAPEQARSGIYHDGKVYETDGEHAIGIHDPVALSLLTPLGTPPSVRLFERFRTTSGGEELSYRFSNVSGLAGPNGELSLDLGERSIDFCAHVVGVVSDTGSRIDVLEAPQFVLGYAVYLQLYDVELDAKERTLEIAAGASHDFGAALGPYLTTPDDLTEFTVGSDPTELVWNYRIRVNDDEVAAGATVPGLPFSSLLAHVSDGRTVHAGEVIGWPALEKRPLSETPLGRELLPTDRIEVTVDGLGTLVTRIA